MKNRRIFSLGFKMQVLKKYEETKSISFVGRHFDLHRKTLRNWIKNKEKIKKNKFKRSRYHINRANKCFFTTIEIELNDWIKEMRSRCACISGLLIKNKALSIATSNQIANFKASNGWLERFLDRFNYTLRRVTSVGRDLPLDHEKILKEFLDRWKGFSNLEREDIFNMDETSIYLDFPGRFYPYFFSSSLIDFF